MKLRSFPPKKFEFNIEGFFLQMLGHYLINTEKIIFKAFFKKKAKLANLIDSSMHFEFFLIF